MNSVLEWPVHRACSQPCKGYPQTVPLKLCMSSRGSREILGLTESFSQQGLAALQPVNKALIK
jgi:hypothetical protein